MRWCQGTGAVPWLPWLTLRPNGFAPEIQFSLFPLCLCWGLSPKCVSSDSSSSQHTVQVSEWSSGRKMGFKNSMHTRAFSSHYCISKPLHLICMEMRGGQGRCSLSHCSVQMRKTRCRERQPQCCRSIPSPALSLLRHPCPSEHPVLCDSRWSAILLQDQAPLPLLLSSSLMTQLEKISPLNPYGTLPGIFTVSQFCIW